VPDSYHHPLCTDLNILTSSSQAPWYSFRKYVGGDYAMLYEMSILLWLVLLISSPLLTLLLTNLTLYLLIL
jgi:hypothetical protein